MKTDLLVAILAFTIFIIGCVPVVFLWRDCSSRGGIMVRALSWTGYACLERPK